MWNPDEAPVFSFERHARLHGLNAARERWAQLEFEHKRQKQEAHAIELAMAARAEKNGPYVVNEELGQVQWEMAAHSYWELHRSSVHERGCVGGELMKDEDYMRYFLKKNPECTRKSISGHIMSGWTPGIEDAAEAGRQERETQQQQRGGLILNA